MKIELDIDVSELNVAKEAFLKYAYINKQDNLQDFVRANIAEGLYDKILSASLETARKETGM